MLRKIVLLTRLAFCLLLLGRIKPLTTTIVFSLTLLLADFKAKALPTLLLVGLSLVQELPHIRQNNYLR
ncbi:hypothetical protein J2T18_000316 [Paenibacillus polymyxa]|nr:hypothetical protein [Paenibacillus polymyxa]